MAVRIDRNLDATVTHLLHNIDPAFAALEEQDSKGVTQVMESFLRMFSLARRCYCRNTGAADFPAFRETRVHSRKAFEALLCGQIGVSCFALRMETPLTLI